MKTLHFCRISICACSLLLVRNAYSQVIPSATENYIHSIEPIYENTVADEQTPGIRTVQYFDGLGRPKQLLQVKASATDKDIVTKIEYDGLGIQVKEYLPIPSSQSNGAYIGTVNGTFYQDNYGESVWYAHKEIENSALNRVIKQAAPGDDWQLNSGKEIKFQYLTNTVNDAVKKFKVSLTGDNTPSLVQNLGNYAANFLYKNVTTDENDHKIEEFKNLEGQVILKRTYIIPSSVAGRGTDPGNPPQTPTRVDTYYVYDLYGNLTYVIPPLASAKASLTSMLLADLCFQYRYDTRKRLIEKQLPGKGKEFMVYDKQDRLVAIKDAKQAAENNNEWTFIKYDKFGRVAYNGLVWDPRDRAAVQSWVNGMGSNNAQYDTTGFMHDDLKVYYKADQGYPTESFHILTINYYDSYIPSRETDGATFPSLPGVDIRNGDTNIINESLTGMLTSSVTRIMGTWSFEKTYTFYDIKSRPVWTHKINHLGGYTKTQNNLDFRGKPNSTITFHKYGTNSTEISIQDNFTYDTQERLKSHNQIINNGIAERIATNTYNEIGQLTYKLVGNRNSLPALQGVDYSYNIRGWLTGINDITSTLQLRGLPGEPMDDIFAFKIQYNDLIFGGETATQPLYNGNISQTFWKSASDNKTRGYSYEYDQMNRLRFAHFNRLTGTSQTGYYPGAFDESMAYDLNGNIVHLIRHTEDANGVESAMDDLKYTYKSGNNNSNQLLKVVDDTNSTVGFTNGSSGTSNDYTYDANGNMISDLNKNITSIDYNYMNLPVKIKWNNSETRKIEYLYNAAGIKVQKKVTNGTAISTTDYLDGFQYLNGILQFFPHGEGYVKQTTVNNLMTFDYVYNYTDHLGNIRMSYTKDPQTGDLKILEENHYFPFGLKHKTYANVDRKIDAINDETNKAIVVVDPNNDWQKATLYKYKYNGKELQDELGLNWYDYGARNYQPDLGRWMNIDPLAEKFFPSSAYTYTANNPILLNDPDGRDWSISTRRDGNGHLHISITFNGAIVNNSEKKIDVQNYIKEQTAQFNRIFSYSDKDNTVTANLNLREIDNESEVKGSEHLVVIGDPSNFPDRKGGHADMGGLRVDLNSKMINNDGTSFNHIFSHEAGHTGGLVHPFSKDKTVDFFAGYSFWGLKENRTEASIYSQKVDVDVTTNFMSYPDKYYGTGVSTNAEIEARKVLANPGKATVGQINAIIRYYNSGLLNKDNR